MSCLPLVYGPFLLRPSQTSNGMARRTKARDAGVLCHAMIWSWDYLGQSFPPVTFAQSCEY